MLTLRDDDSTRLMKRAKRALKWLADNKFAPTSTRNANGRNNANSSDGAAPICPTHNKPMLASKHGSGWYCPVKVADDDGTGKPVYCKQRAQ